jgi:hypothetical protein
MVLRGACNAHSEVSWRQTDQWRSEGFSRQSPLGGGVRQLAESVRASWNKHTLVVYNCLKLCSCSINISCGNSNSDTNSDKSTNRVIVSVQWLTLTLTLEAEVRLNNMKEISPYLKQNTSRHHYNQLVDAVYVINPFVHWDSHDRHGVWTDHKMHSCRLLQQSLYTVPAGI